MTLILVVLFSSCNPKYRVTLMNDMKTNIPELIEFVDNHSASLDAIIDVHSELVDTRYTINNGKVTMLGIGELQNKMISESYITLCDYFDNSTMDAINQIIDACPDYTHINITPYGVTILFRQNEHRSVELFLSSYYRDDVSEERGGYCERINDTWNALIYYNPPA